jgi:hypothetical protein
MISDHHRIAVLCLLLAAGACAGQRPAASTASPLPREIHGLPLTDSTTGAAAARLVDRMHDKGVAPVATWVGVYGGGATEATLYVSRYRTPAEAAAQLAVMAGRIGSGTALYGHHSAMTIAGTTVHTVLGGGQVHYFFARGADLTWLAIPPPIGRPGLAQVLAVPVDSVPSAAGPAPLPSRPGRDSVVRLRN